MSTRIQLDLPDTLAKEARERGLLASGPISNLLELELRRRKAAESLSAELQKIHARPGNAPPMNEIVDEVRAARRERRVCRSPM